MEVFAQQINELVLKIKKNQEYQFQQIIKMRNKDLNK